MFKVRSVEPQKDFRSMYMLIRIFSLIAFAAAMSFAQLAPEPQVADIKLMMDSTTNKPMKMDFSKHLSGISDPGILFSHFSNRPLLIYYFSPKCPHCQKHFPEIQNLIREYESKGLTGIAIGLNGGIKKNDIRLFIDQYHAVIPVFQDTDSKFGPAYGTGCSSTSTTPSSRCSRIQTASSGRPTARATSRSSTSCKKTVHSTATRRSTKRT